jgi:hypothetical protein
MRSTGLITVAATFTGATTPVHDRRLASSVVASTQSIRRERAWRRIERASRWAEHRRRFRHARRRVSRRAGELWYVIVPAAVVVGSAAALLFR